MANEVVQEKEYEDYIRWEKFANGWLCGRTMSTLLIAVMMLSVVPLGNAFGVKDDAFSWKMIVTILIAISPMLIHLFFVTGTADRKVRELGTKVVNDFLGEGWLPEGASFYISRGKVTVELKYGKVLKSTVQEIVMGKGLWKTAKSVKLEFGDAIRWHNEYPPRWQY